MNALTLQPTLLGSGGGDLLQHRTVFAVIRESGVVELTPSVTGENNAVLLLKSCACGCGEQFIATSSKQKYLDNLHRQKAYRDRKSNKLETTKKRCLWCSSSMKSKSKTAKFCCDSCRQMSYRKQRDELVNTFAVFSGVDYDTAFNIVETVGARHTRKTLEIVGYDYDYKRRVWSRCDEPTQ